MNTALTTLKARLALAPAPRLVSLQLKEEDVVVLADPDDDATGPSHMAHVTFGCSANSRVLLLDLYTNGTYSVASSTTMSTHGSLEVLEAYERGLKFIREYGLTPRV